MMRYRLPLPRAATSMVGAALVIALTACGDGGVVNPGSGGTGNDNTDTTSIGPISGFGSIIVNDVRFDDSAAELRTERGASLSSDELRLGMMVAVKGVSSSSALTGTANQVIVFSEIKGFVESATAQTLVISGISLRLLGSTVIDGAASLNPGDYVEAYGVFDNANNELIATRIEKKDAEDFKLRGVVSEWDSAGFRFRLGSLIVGYSGVSLPEGFANGSSIRAYASGQPTAGVWSVSEIRLASDRSNLSDGRVEIKGVITRFGGLDDFTLNDIPVDGSTALIRDGTVNDLVPGAWLEVEGSIENGRLIATEIEIENDSSNENDEFEVNGFISDFVSTADFRVRNTRIDASQSPRYEDGDPSLLANGVCVEVRGTLEAQPGGSIVRATRVSFDDDCD